MTASTNRTRRGASSRRGTVVTVGLVVVGLAGFGATQATAKLIGSATDRSQFGPYAITSGGLSNPRVFRVVVRSEPNHRKLNSLSEVSMTCTRGGRTKSDDTPLNGRTPFDKRLPTTLRRADSCGVSAGAGMNSSGKIMIRLYGKKR